MDNRRHRKTEREGEHQADKRRKTEKGGRIKTERQVGSDRLRREEGDYRGEN